MAIIRKMVKALAVAAILVQAGCASYSFRSNVPEELRTIAVPVFENDSGFPELDAVVTQYVLREFQREGTFKLARYENASVRLTGKLVSSRHESFTYDRNYNSRASEYRYTVTVRISLWEAGSGKMLINNQPISAQTTFLTQGDMLTGLQDAYPRVAKELSRKIVDTVLAQW